MTVDARKLGFKGWLWQQRKREDAVGALSATLHEDACAVRLSNERSLTQHLMDQHSAAPELLATVAAAYEEWREYSTRPADA